MPNFAPSPILLPTKLVGAVASTVAQDSTGDRNSWLDAHKGIRQYLAIVARTAANAGIDPAFQAAVLAQENGGFEKWSETAHSNADANGIAQFIPSTWSGSWNPYRNQSPNKPQYAIPAQSIYLRNLLKEYNGDMSKAAAAYYGDHNPNGAYALGVRKYYNELTSNHVFDKAGKSILSGIGDAASSVVDDITGPFNAAKNFADVLLHPTRLAELAADAFAWWVKLVWKSIWKYVLAPPFHWCQRATIYYYENIMGSRDGENEGFYYDYAAGVTVAFWAIGYGILWRRADDYSSATMPQDTPLGHAVSSASGVVARRNIASPSKAKDHTPEKPTPKVSKASVSKTRSLSASRRRQVAVGTVKDGENARESRDRTDSEAASADETTNGTQDESNATETEAVAT